MLAASPVSTTPKESASTIATARATNASTLLGFKVPGPAIARAGNTDDTGDANDDARRRCIPGEWRTKAKCKHECDGRGQCQFEPDILHRKWVCVCPFARIKARAASSPAATPSPAADSTAEGSNAETSSDDTADTGAATDDANGRCINGEYRKKAECKRHCRRGGHCDFFPDVRKHWLCICT
ncbi:MAG: hypothetical protein LQ339_001574 [Xanthoria mediterranea]|nr:MAG: hypothetical protein LQ339_001574 [Xanthoria mediterranea]